MTMATYNTVPTNMLVAMKNLHPSCYASSVHSTFATDIVRSKLNPPMNADPTEK